MKTKSRYIMTLALLLTAASGAWAQDPKVYTSEVDMSVLKVGDILAEGFSLKADKDNKVNLNANRYRISDAPSTSDKELYKSGITVGTNCVLTYNSVDYIPVNEDGKDGNVWVITKITKNYSYIDINISGSGTAETPITVDWNASTKTGTFSMPAGNVTVEPEYYAQAMFATESNEALTPTAAEDAIAGTDAPLIVEGTVAKAGQTDDAQGQVMYAVTTTADAAPALDAFSATVPTAEDYDDATTVFVWYYIQGADAPTGTVPSDDNTFSDSDISGTPLQVNVLSNKFTLTFDPAPVEKVDVTVDGQAATPTQDGKLENVPMDKQVKMTAKDGYKFRKVEVKKAAPALKTLTVNGMQLKYVEGDTWQQAIERPENEGSGWRVQNNYIFNGGYTLFINEGAYVYVRPGDTIGATKNYSLEAD